MSIALDIRSNYGTSDQEDFYESAASLFNLEDCDGGRIKLREYIQTVSPTKKKIFGTLSENYRHGENPKIPFIRQVAWECFFENKEVVIIDAAWGEEKEISPAEARVIVEAARRTQILRTLIFKGYRLQHSVAQILRSSGKIINIDESVVEAQDPLRNLKISCMIIGAFFAGAALFTVYKSP